MFDVLLPTDVFPPKTGGAGWSTFALAQALQDRGHRVLALVPQRGKSGISYRVEQGVDVVDVGYHAPSLPFVANYARFERFWSRFGQAIVQVAGDFDRERLIIHGQHIQGIGAGVLAGAQLGVPVVATVRDHWARHYFATGLHGDQFPYDRWNWAGVATDLIARNQPLVGLVSTLAVPYIQAHMNRRRAFLARCDAVISLSNYITQHLHGIVAPDKLHPIPNIVDLDLIERIIATPQTSIKHDQPYVLFVGKLARNKGAYLLPTVMQAMHHAGANADLVIAGGSDASLIKHIEATGTRVHALNWADHDEVLRLMHGAAALVFPSTWGEPLSRVLLEACAVGMPIAAMPTGGTPDILVHKHNAMLASTAELLGQAVAQLVRDRTFAQRLAQNARRTAHERFAAQVVIEQVEQVYERVQRR